MKKIITLILGLFLVSCQTTPPPCTKILRDFYIETASHDMNMDIDAPKRDTNAGRMQFVAFNESKVMVLCLIETGVTFEAAHCVSGTISKGACRYKEGRYMGYSYGEASASDLVKGIK